jgi:predicted Rossmann fold nucleotide-binding protein DprA/Smf involved in DNA uptake
MQLSTDGQAIALACSSLALAGERSIKPLTSREWQQLCGALARSEWGRPGELLGRKPAELHRELGMATDTAERLSLLLARGGQLAFEVDRLASRGIWVLTRADDAYPPRLKKLLDGQAPPVLYGAGPQSALREPSLAVIGSRDADPAALAFARGLGRHCARQRVAIVSGAARGVDLEAMAGAVEAGGIAIGVTVDPLERLVRRPALRTAVADDALTLVTPYHPSARWQAGNAMRRNRFVYAMSQAAVVAATAAKSGGTWAGAIENIERRWVPVYVRVDGDAGSRELARAGAWPLPPGPVENIDVQSLFDGYVPSLLREAEHADAAKESADRKSNETDPVAKSEDDVHGDLPARSPHTAPPASPSQMEPGDAHDAFWAVWPLLYACLQEPRSEREVAEALRLQLAQARTWLNRAAEEDLVKVKSRPRKLYVVGEGDHDQLRLG